MSSNRYQKDLDKDALEWRAPQVAEFLRFRCLEWPPSHCAEILEEIWQGILQPFFENRPKDIKKQVILADRLANVDSIWAPVGPLSINYIPVTDVCSAIAFVLSMVTPPHPEDDWLSIAAIFVHFCRVASREDRPKTVHIIWQTANEQRFPARKRPLILVDEVIKAAQATSAHPARDGNTAGPSPKGGVSVFRAQKIDELLDATTGGAWREWPLTMKPMSPRTPMTARSFEERSIEAAFPHCRCSAMIPTFFAINQRRPVSALAFNFKNFHELLRQFKREEIHYSALCEAVLPACKACHRVMKQIGLDYTDVALSSTIPKELLASEYDLEDDVDEDYEVVDRNQSDSDERYDSPLTPSPSPPRNYEPYPSHPPAHPQNQSLSVLNPRYPHSPTQAPLPISKLYPPSPSPSPPKTLQAAPAEVPKSLKTPVVNRSWMRSSPVASQQLTETITAKGRKVAPLIMPPPPLPHGNGANNRPSSPQPQVPQARAQAPPKSSAAKRHPNGTVSPPSSPSPPPNVVQQQQAQARQTAHYPWFLFPTSFTQQQALAYPHHFRQQPAPASPQRMAQQPYDMKMMLPTQFMHAQPSAAYAQRGASAQQQEWQEQQPSQPPRPQNRARYAYSVAPTSGPLQFMPAPPDHQAYFTHALALVPVGHGSRPHPVPPLPTAVPPLTVEPLEVIPPAPAASISPVPVESPTPLTLALSTDSEPPTRPPSVPSYIESAPPTRPPSVSPPPLPPKDTSFMRASAFALPDSPHYPSIPSPSPRPHATQHQIFHEYPHIQPALGVDPDAFMGSNASLSLVKIKNKAKSVISLFKKPPAIEEAESESSPSERDEDVATLATVSEARSQYRRWGLSPHASIQDVAGWEESQWDEEEPSTPRAPTFDMYGAPSMSTHEMGDDDEDAEYDEWRNEGTKKFSRMFKVKSGSSSSPSPPRYGHGHIHGRSRSATIASSYAVSPPSTYSRNRPITSSPTMSTTRARSGSGAIPPKMQLYHHGMSVAPSASDNTVYHPSSVYSADEYESDSSVTTPVFPSNYPRRGFVY